MHALCCCCCPCLIQISQACTAVPPCCRLPALVAVSLSADPTVSRWQRRSSIWMLPSILSGPVWLKIPRVSSPLELTPIRPRTCTCVVSRTATAATQQVGCLCCLRCLQSCQVVQSHRLATDDGMYHGLVTTMAAARPRLPVRVTPAPRRQLQHEHNGPLHVRHVEPSH